MCFDGCSLVCERLARNDPSLTVLNLNHRYMGNDGAKAVARALVNNTAVLVIFLQHNLLGPSGVQALVNALQGHERLTHLYLDYNNLGDESCPALAQLLTSCPALQVLKVADNAIGCHGIETITRSALCQPNLPLQYLSLQNNALGRTGMKALCEALRTNQNLRWLDVRCNKIHPQHYGQVTEAWTTVLRETNQTLCLLELWETAEVDAITSPSRAKCLDELTYWLQWNRAGRRSLTCYSHSTPVPTTYLLANAADPKVSSPTVIMATLLARPDLLVSPSSSSC
uniref:Uncharacterized protein n=1 Tax=Amphora coffeiformis TaxID=265554 RepID=A0A7S3L0Z0_9STRA